jgi:hypothetical protein
MTYLPVFWHPPYFGPNTSEGDLITDRDARGTFRRIGSAMLYDGPRWAVFVPYAGLAAGYCWGDLELSYSIRDPEDHPFGSQFFEQTKQIGTPSIRMITGLRMDVFDLAFAEAEFSYEPVGPYLQVKNLTDLSYANTFTFGFAFGAFIF